jgi:hypothetical protein
LAKDKAKSSSIFVPDNQLLRERRFQEQCFLMSFYESFVNFSRNNSRYENVVMVESDQSAATIPNKLFSKGIPAFINIKGHELSYLQPHFELFKVYKNQNGQETILPLPFDDFTDPRQAELILQGVARRGGGVGLQSFEWEDTGKNPAETGKAFVATMKLLFNTTEDIYKVRSEEGGFVSSFADIFRPPPNAKLPDGRRNTEAYQIRVKVGWSTPVDSSGFISDELFDEIQKTQQILNLNLFHHDLDFEESGKITATIRFIASIEALMNSEFADVLLINSNNIKRRINELRELEEEEAQTSGRLQRFEQRNADALEKNELNRNQRGNPRSYVRGISVRDERDAIAARLNTIRDRIQEIQIENRAKSYARLLELLEFKQRIFYIDIEREERELLGIIEADAQLTGGESAKRRAELSDRNRQRIQNKVANLNASTLLSSDSAIRQLRDNINKQTAAVVAGQELPSFGNLNVSTEEPQEPGNYRVYLVFLGDIINAALSVLYRDFDAENSFAGRKFDREEFRVALGPIEIYNEARNEKENVNLADIPIALNKFQEWFIEKVIRTGRTNYPIGQFLKDLISELVVDAISPRCFALGEEQKRAFKSRLTMTTFSTRQSEKKLDLGKRVNVDRNITLTDELRSPDASRNFLFIYAYSGVVDDLNGDLEQTHKRVFTIFILGQNVAS